MDKKNIIFNCTLEHYTKKYRNRRHKLLKFTKKQIEDFDKEYGHYVFNNKTYVLEYKQYLLKNRKWALIGDTYYEIPKPIRFTWFRNLNIGVQISTCILLAGAVAGGAYGISYSISMTHKNPVAIIDSSLSEYLKINGIENDKDGNTVIHLNVLKQGLKEPEVVKGDYKLVAGTDYYYDGNPQVGSFDIIICKASMEKHPGQIVIKTKEQVEYYKIDWITKKFDDGGYTKSLHDFATTAKTIEFKESNDVQSGIHCGETEEDKVYFNYDKNQKSLEVWSSGKIVFEDNDRPESYGFFNMCYNATSLILKNIDTSKVTNFGTTFSGCVNLASIDVSEFDTSSATNMSDMFSMYVYGMTPSVAQNIIGLDKFKTDKVTNMLGMFDYCNASSLDLSSFDTKSLTNSDRMFYYCSNLRTIFVSDKFVNNNITSSMYMFYQCSKLTGGNGSTLTSIQALDSTHYLDATHAIIDTDKTRSETAGYFTKKA